MLESIQYEVEAARSTCVSLCVCVCVVGRTVRSTYSGDRSDVGQSVASARARTNDAKDLLLALREQKVSFINKVELQVLLRLLKWKRF